MAKIEVPHDAISCNSAVCSSHSDVISKYYNDIILACISAANLCIPAGKGKSKAGWSEHVAPYRERCIFWYRYWTDNDKPRSGLVFDLYHKAGLDYKRASRWVLRNQEKLSSAQMSRALLDNMGRSFWTEVKKKNSKSVSHPDEVDDVVGPANICKVFKDKYDA